MNKEISRPYSWGDGNKNHGNKGGETKGVMGKGECTLQFKVVRKDLI